MIKELNENISKKLFNEILNEKIEILSEKRYDEKTLKATAEYLKAEESINIERLLNLIINNNINQTCDWNIGSIFNI